MSDQAFHNVGLEPELVQQAFTDSDDQGAAAGIAYALTNPINSQSCFSDGYDGRLPAAATLSMAGAFRTPMMRCVALRPTFFHTGQIQTLAEAVSYFHGGGGYTGFPGTSEIHPLGLPALDESDLVAFLQSLTGPGVASALMQAPSP